MGLGEILDVGEGTYRSLRAPAKGTGNATAAGCELEALDLLDVLVFRKSHSRDTGRKGKRKKEFVPEHDFLFFGVGRWFN